MNVVNLAAYQFVSLDGLPALQEYLLERCTALGLRGTVLLAPEGINLFVAGEPEQIGAFMDYLRTDPLFEGKFADLEFKESVSATQPFGQG